MRDRFDVFEPGRGAGNEVKYRRGGEENRIKDKKKTRDDVSAPLRQIKDSVLTCSIAVVPWLADPIYVNK